MAHDPPKNTEPSSWTCAAEAGSGVISVADARFRLISSSSEEWP